MASFKVKTYLKKLKTFISLSGDIFSKMKNSNNNKNTSQKTITNKNNNNKNNNNNILNTLQKRPINKNQFIIYNKTRNNIKILNINKAMNGAGTNTHMIITNMIINIKFKIIKMTIINNNIINRSINNIKNKLQNKLTNISMDQIVKTKKIVITNKNKFNNNIIRRIIKQSIINSKTMINTPLK